MRALELKVPPPLVALVVGVLMWLVSRFATAFDFGVPARHLFAIVPVACGVITAFSGFLAFRRAKTTVNPTTPLASSSLVSGGVYKMTRNPMYLGLLLLLTGWAIFLSNALAALLFLPAYVLYINRFQIVPEERALTSLFGKDYVAYQARVRRWL
jgi:protein-S-isoprenylcysteine O-methyltransferase Ste14